MEFGIGIATSGESWKLAKRAEELGELNLAFPSFIDLGHEPGEFLFSRVLTDRFEEQSHFLSVYRSTSIRIECVERFPAFLLM